MIVGSCSPPTGKGRPRLEVADIIRTAGEAYRDRYAPSLDQLKVMSAIARCRTVVLGGHLDVCGKCGFEKPSYNSCRNRHCPKCQSLAQAHWLEQRRQRIVPTRYFHVVFTLPHELRSLARTNPKKIYDLILESAARTLLDFGHSRLHAQLGVTAVLHTWTRELRFHPHAHCIVTAGGLAEREERWVPARSRYLFPVEAMSKVFRGKILEGIKRLRDDGRLSLRGAAASLADPKVFKDLRDDLYRKDWVVYAKAPFGGPEQVFQYLGRYTHRVGLSNQRLLSFDGREVCFRTKNGKTATVAAVEFVRRFLLHVLPTGFVKIRHYGLVAAANVNTKLEIARRCLTSDGAVPRAEPSTDLPRAWRDVFLALTGIDLLVCPSCGVRSIERRPLPRASPQQPKTTDTS